VASETKTTTLVSLATLKTWLGVTTNDADEKLALLADAATELIERDTGVQFVTRAYTEVHDGAGQQVLLLKYWPITTVTSLSITAAPGETPEAIDSADRTTDAANGRIYLHDRVVPCGFQNVEVVYSAGYGAKDAATLPPDVVHTAVDLVKLLRQETEANALLAGSQTFGAGLTFTVRPTWPIHITNTLKAWRRPLR
jgi:uncharacterized phiE125 gp8 family phage protein